MSKEKKLCSGDDCFKTVDVGDFVTRPDGTLHELSTLCWDCRPEGAGKKLRKYKQRLRQKEKKQTKKDSLTHQEQNNGEN